MNKNELIALAKELSEKESLKGREADLSYLRREWQKLINREEETFYEQQLTNEFLSYYELIAKKEGSLVASSLQEKQALIAKAKELLNRNDVVKASREMDETFRSFKSAGRCSREQDDALWAEFKAVKDEFNAKKDAYFANLKEQNEAKKAKKEEIITKAKEVLQLENIKDATAKMDELMDEWKKVGFSGKEYDDKLWEEFSQVRKEFQNKRKEHFEHMKDVYVERVAKKEEILKRLKKFVADAEWTEEELKTIKDYRAEWKNVGFAGKEKEDELYAEFEAQIKKYFDEKKFYTF